MSSNHYSSIDPATGNVSWNGPLSIEKGDHSHMPSRSSVFLSPAAAFLPHRGQREYLVKNRFILYLLGERLGLAGGSAVFLSADTFRIRSEA